MSAMSRKKQHVKKHHVKKSSSRVSRLSLSISKLSLKQAYSDWRNSLSGNDKDPPRSPNIDELEVDDYNINMDNYIHRTGLSAESSLKEAVEDEQNTRRRTLEREEQKQEVQKRKGEKKKYDLALLISKKNSEYYKILCGPVIHEVFYGYIRFADCQQYIQNDINILKKCAKLKIELEGSDIFQYFCNYSADPNDVQNGVNFNFADVSKVQLYRFKHKSVWDSHKRMQQNTNCDVFIVANDENVPIYVFLDVDIDLIEERITFSEMHPYQNGDVHLLEKISMRNMDFALNTSFLFFKKGTYNVYPYNFAEDTIAQFKFGICHLFMSKFSKNTFYHQSLDIALATNDTDEFVYLLSDVQYDLINKSVEYKSCHFYRNGDYNRLRECGKEVKYVKIKKWKMNTIDKTKYNLNVCQKCLLFNLENKSLWNQYVEKQKASQFDIATITDSTDYQTYILFDVTVNYIDQVVDYKICEEFKAEHHEIIENHGELISTEKMDEFVVNDFYFEDTDLNNIFLYQLNCADINGGKYHSRHRRSRKKKSKRKKKHRQNTMIARSDFMEEVTDEKSQMYLDNDMLRVWSAYLDIYGFPPESAQQLKSFSRLQDQSKTLSYSQARALFKYYMKI